MAADRIEVLSAVACATHLRQEVVGRFAVIVDGHPEIFLVSYVTDDAGDIYFRSDTGTELYDAIRGQTIAFEIDGIDEQRKLGWSVVAVGEASWIADTDKVDEVRAKLQLWAGGDEAHIVGLHPDKVTGRRIAWSIGTAT